MQPDWLPLSHQAAHHMMHTPQSKRYQPSEQDPFAIENVTLCHADGGLGARAQSLLKVGCPPRHACSEPPSAGAGLHRAADKVLPELLDVLLLFVIGLVRRLRRSAQRHAHVRVARHLIRLAPAIILQISRGPESAGTCRQEEQGQIRCTAMSRSAPAAKSIFMHSSRPFWSPRSLSCAAKWSGVEPLMVLRKFTLGTNA